MNAQKTENKMQPIAREHKTVTDPIDGQDDTTGKETVATDAKKAETKS